VQEPEGFLASFQEWEKLKELGWLTQRFSRSRSKRVKHTILVGTSLFAVIAVATLSPTAHARGSWKTADPCLQGQGGGRLLFVREEGNNRGGNLQNNTSEEIDLYHERYRGQRSDRRTYEWIIGRCRGRRRSSG
jgi:hypothetical protein